MPMRKKKKRKKKKEKRSWDLETCGKPVLLFCWRKSKTIMKMDKVKWNEKNTSLWETAFERNLREFKHLNLFPLKKSQKLHHFVKNKCFLSILKDTHLIGFYHNICAFTLSYEAWRFKERNYLCSHCLHPTEQNFSISSI